MKKNETSTAPPIAQRTFTIRDTAAVLGVCRNSVRRLIDRGVFTPCRALRVPLIPLAQIEKLLNSKS